MANPAQPRNQLGANWYQQSQAAQVAAQAANTYQAQINAMLGQQFNHTYRGYSPKPDWVFAGTPCRDALEFAHRMWPEDCAEKTAFVLRWQGRTANP